MNQPASQSADISVDFEDTNSPPFASHEGPLPAQTPSSPVDAIARARDIDELERIRRAVLAAGEAAYHWDIKSDKIVWSGNVKEIIPSTDDDQITTGRSYADLLDTENATSRYDAVMRSQSKDQGEGVPFAIEYLIHPQSQTGRQSLWVEDCGRWHAGKDGLPAEVFGIVRRIDDRHERDERLHYIGNCDPLTGMMNRGRLSEALAETMARAEDENTSCAFLIAIINNLAVVNDAYGFDIADEVIVSVGHRLQRVVRAGDMIGRYSGAKFGIILSECSEDEIRIAAERFLSVARDNVFETERGPVWAMLSIGGIVLPKFAGDANSAMANAEEALAEAKRQPTDFFVPYRPSAERISVRSLNARCAAEIVSSLKEDRFTLAYQPIVNAKTGEPEMFEALLRMRCEDGDTVAAHHLIPIAEKLGLVRMIDRAVARLAVDTLALNSDLSISLNISGTTATDPRWFSQLTTILSEVPGAADRIILEITESVALQDLDETVRLTRSLRELGCRVAIDDFGAGYTSFKNLRELDIDIVKIDGSFCEHLSQNRDNQYFVRSLIDLARKFDLKTVAEWVQSQEDADLLRSWGIDYMQGNLFGEALTDVAWSLPAREPTVDKPEQVVAFDASLISAALQQHDDDSNDTEAPEQVQPEDAEQPFDAGFDVAALINETVEGFESDQFEPGFGPSWPPGNPDSRAASSNAPDNDPAGDSKDDNTVASGFDPINVELNLSLLQSAKAGLDASFGTGTTARAEKHPDLATAIASAFGDDRSSGA
ncbi:MAG: EAL domain-containing protein [Aestuariivirgaceae bacterium]